MKKVAILGSTGSIGTQTLDVIRRYPDKLRVYSLVAYSNASKLNEQAREFNPEYSALIGVDGEDCLIQAVQGCDLAVVATRGICSIESVLYCINHGIDVAIANKEALVCAGSLITEALQRGKSRLIPIDSEHFAISQCLVGRDSSCVSKLLLTASGGPFREFALSELNDVTPLQALKHPNWSMGQKITVDSATMANKALEVIEAKWLFGVDPNLIEIVVHPQSVVHSMVEFSDGSVIAQMGRADLRIPIQSALLNRCGDNLAGSVNFAELRTLTFESCDFERFPCAKLGHEIFRYPPLCATVMNAANDVCVESFLRSKLSFTGFYNIISRTIDRFSDKAARLQVNVDNIKLLDGLAKNYVYELINGDIC